MDGAVSAFLRSIVIFFILLLFTKILGKREISQLSFIDFVSAITMGDIAANLSYNLEGEMGKGFSSLMVWVFLPFLLSYMALHFKWVRRFLNGNPVVVIRQGKVMEDNLRKVRYSIDDLMQQLRQRNVFHVADVEFAVLEASGQLTVLKKADLEQPTRRDLSVPAELRNEPHVVIEDGHINHEALTKANLDPGWLLAELERKGVLLSNVFLGQVDSQGNLYVDLYDDNLPVPASTHRQATLALLKQAQANLEMFALQSEKMASKGQYEQLAKDLDHVVRGIEPFLRGGGVG
ncbi:DUF421 domain-containing protein [Kyrpidia sp.]|uniref:DUF421 domain-containing protein n=1 Tax=Kyrpidia sp. TaxID=2073077 RepID=UPI00258CC438|nr:DUF421 domain-containing protein [Kyrpidia sp.]MCL6577478.1 DUF421 domain-containing protein [Kyrpidia sp.]